MKEISLTSKIPPSVNHYLGYRAVPKYKNGKKVYIVVSYLTAEAKDYKEYFSKYAKEQVEKQKWDIEQTRYIHHYADCVYYFPRTDMDEQNYPKVTSDTLNGIAYIDDSRVLFRTNRVYYDNENPRVEITIHPVTYRGIFDSQEDLDKFEDKCKTCKRYKRNCSILKKAKEGRIQKEINKEFICSKFSEVTVKKGGGSK
ncbi:RusA family crossover junction endodeoxyribonuclease [Paenibacillus dendritiformis]|uniref:RusA family crossover junction endodeoxyribonuclease n=1 Tax=Paenibacillus dendritiformis TaxID=130049 RepID=UPI00387E0CB8